MPAMQEDKERFSIPEEPEDRKKNSDGAGTGTSDVAGAVADAVGNLAVPTAIEGLADGVSATGGLLADGASALAHGAGAAVEGIGSAAGAAAEAGGEILSAAADVGGEVLGAVGEAIGDILSGIFS